MVKQKKYIMWDGKSLYLWIEGNAHEQLLGGIRTKKGNLTREEKLKAVQFTNQWVEI